MDFSPALILANNQNTFHPEFTLWNDLMPFIFREKVVVVVNFYLFRGVSEFPELDDPEVSLVFESTFRYTWKLALLRSVILH